LDPPVHPELRDLLESLAPSDLQVLQEPPGSLVLQEPLVPQDPLEMMDLPDPWDPPDLRDFRDSLLVQLELLLIVRWFLLTHSKILKISPWHWEVYRRVKILIVK
jgi:hypothetical protein